MEDSSSGSNDGGDGSDDENDNSAQSDGEEPSNESKSILEALSKDENILPALKWLKTCLDDELEDRRTEDDDIEDVPLVPILGECTSAMEVPNFVKLLSMIKLSAPNDQEQYWRIPATLTVTV